MPPDHDPPRPSTEHTQSLAEFQLGSVEMRRRGTDGIWDAIDSLAKQVSTERHSRANLETNFNGLQWRLFGYRNGNGGGAFGEVGRQIAQANQRVSDKLDKQTEDLKSSVNDRLTKAENTLKLMVKVFGVLGAIATGALVIWIGTLLTHIHIST